MHQSELPHYWHSPSKARSTVGIWWDFFLHSKRLYDRQTNTATCAICGAKIKVPSTYGKSLPVWAYSYSLGAVVLALFCVRFLRDYTDLSYAIIKVAAPAFGICVLLLARRINRSILLAREKWNEISTNSSDSSNQHTALREEAKADNKRIRYAEFWGSFAPLYVLWIFNNYLV